MAKNQFSLAMLHGHKNEAFSFDKIDVHLFPVCSSIWTVRRGWSSQWSWLYTNMKHIGVDDQIAWPKQNQSITVSIHFCSAPPVKRYWTPWYNVNSPYKGSGDYETLVHLRAAGKKVCQHPLQIQAVRAKDHKDARKTGERIYKYDTRTGFICLNKDQRRTNSYRPPVCSDYKVRFYC